MPMTSVDVVTSPPESDAEVMRRLAAERFTCRAYLPRQVSTDVIHGILDISRRTASWCNVQPWQAVITQGDSTDAFRDALMEHARNHPGVNRADLEYPPEYRGVYKNRRRESGLALYAALEITRDDTARRNEQSFENFRLFGAPHVAIITTPKELGAYAMVDCGAFVGSFLLAARSFGVSTSPQAALARHSDFLRAYFNIDDALNVVCGISFGYADMSHPVNSFRTSRAATEELVRIV